MQGTFGEGVGVEGGFYCCGRGRGEDFGAHGGVLDVVEGEAGTVGGDVRAVGVIGDRFEVAGGYAGFEDQVPVSFGDAAAVIEDR